MNRVREAQQAYDKLASGDRIHADKLLTAFKRWVESRRTTPFDGVDLKMLSDVASWIAEKEMAGGKGDNVESDHQW